MFNEVGKVFPKGVRCNVGCGDRIRFWLDEQAADIILSGKFPRSFHVVNIKISMLVF